MSRYRKISLTIHGDEKVLALSRPAPNGRDLWIHLLIGPSTTQLPGLFSRGEAGLAEELGWSLAGFRRAWQEVAAQGLAEADWHARVVFLPKAIRHNPPPNPNVVKSWRQPFDHIPASPLKNHALAAWWAHLRTLPGEKGEAFRAMFVDTFLDLLPPGFPEGSGQPSTEPLIEHVRQRTRNRSQDRSSNRMPIQEQEQEQEDKHVVRPSIEEAPVDEPLARTLAELESLEAAFERLWSTWPPYRRREKATAREVYARLVRTDPALRPMIQRAAEAWARTDDWRREGGKYAPELFRWLRKRRWTDELPPETDAAEANGYDPDRFRRTMPAAIEVPAGTPGAVPVQGAWVLEVGPEDPRHPSRRRGGAS